MNKKEKFLLNKIEESVDISPDFSKINNKIIINKPERKGNNLKFRLNFARTVLASILLAGIIIPITLTIDDKINDGNIASSENNTFTPSNIPSEEEIKSETVENEDLEDHPNLSHSEQVPESSVIPTITINGFSYYLFEKFDEFFNEPDDETLAKQECITQDDYYIYLSLMLAYDYVNDIWYELEPLY